MSAGHAQRGRAKALGPAVLLEGLAVADARALIVLGIRAAGRDGIRQPARIDELRRAFDEAAAAMAEVGHADVREVASSASSVAREDTDVETSEVASMTGLSERQARRLVSELGGRKRPSGTWQIERELVESYLAQRQEREA